MKLYLPIERYVGGEEYVVIDKEIPMNTATSEQIREYLAFNSNEHIENMYLRQTYGNKIGRYLRERRRLERYARREERYCMLLLKRKA